MPNVQPGQRYRHYKTGDVYRILEVLTFCTSGDAKLSLDGARVVRYEVVHGICYGPSYVRPESEFFDRIKHGRRAVLRFELVHSVSDDDIREMMTFKGNDEHADEAGRRALGLYCYTTYGRELSVEDARAECARIIAERKR